jgi:hypothetical protein
MIDYRGYSPGDTPVKVRLVAPEHRPPRTRAPPGIEEGRPGANPEPALATRDGQRAGGSFAGYVVDVGAVNLSKSDAAFFVWMYSIMYSCPISTG